MNSDPSSQSPVGGTVGGIVVPALSLIFAVALGFVAYYLFQGRDEFGLVGFAVALGLGVACAGYGAMGTLRGLRTGNVPAQLGLVVFVVIVGLACGVPTGLFWGGGKKATSPSGVSSSVQTKEQSFLWGREDAQMVHRRFVGNPTIDDVLLMKGVRQSEGQSVDDAEYLRGVKTVAPFSSQ